jgi:mono/diheme cytochrome c family protein
MKPILSFAIFITVSFCTALGEDWQLPAEKPGFKPAKGADLAQANCLMCHSHDYISTQPRLTRDQWKASVKKMQDKYGAPIAPESVEALVDYLVAGYGKAAK